MRNFLLIICLFLLPIARVLGASFDYGYTSNGYKFVKHNHSESSYQHAWCSMHNGIEEYENKDFTRIDCLTQYHAVEFDFANKWAESIGQALHYEYMTGKKGMVVLILENPQKQIVYFNRVKALSKKYNFDVEYITPAILNIKNGTCPYIDCKCHKKATK